MLVRKALSSIVLAVSILGGVTACDREERRVEIDTDRIATDRELAGLEPRQAGNTYYFGFDLRGTPQEDARQYIPFLKYLANATGYSFELRFTPASGNIVDDLGNGKIHFAAIGSGSYILARQKYGVIPLARGINEAGRTEYRAVIVVAPQSAIEKIADLRGRRLAFGNATSTQGYLIPRIMLETNDIGLNDLGSYTFTASHFNCVSEVLAGRADACGMQDTMAREFSRRGLVRVIQISDYFPSSCIACNKNIDPEVRARVTRALLDFRPTGKDATGLYDWEKTEMPNGFAAVTDRDFDVMRHWAKKFNFFGTSGEPP